MAYKFTKEDSRRGGIASGEARRNKKSLKDTLELILTTSLPGDIQQELAAKGFPAETFQDALIVSVIESARNGNAQNFSNIVKLLGEDVQRVEVANFDKSIQELDAWFKRQQEAYSREN